VSCPALFLTTLIPGGPPHLARYAHHPLPQGGEGGSGGPVEVIIVKNYEGHHTSAHIPKGKVAKFSHTLLESLTHSQPLIRLFILTSDSRLLN